MAPSPSSVGSAAADAADGRAPPGALACQRDSSLRSWRSRVVRCDRVRVAATKKTPAATSFEVELLDSVLFPEGGGQPHDTGAIDQHRVDYVFVRDGRCVHRVPAETEDAAPPFAVGQEVETTVDWTRRFDHMQQHSAQHLLSAIADRHGFETTTWSLGDERCNVELVPVGEPKDGAKDEDKAKSKTKQRGVPMDELLQIEREVNAAIVQGLVMAPKLAEPGSPEWTAIAAKFPPDQQPEALRIVCIDGIDANPCCGTHVSNIAQLQSLRLLNVEFARGATRVWFVAGERVNREFARMFQREQQMTKVLSCAPDEHAARADKLLQTQKSALKDVKNLQKELAGFIAADLVAKAKASSSGVVSYHRADGDLGFLQALLSAIGETKDAAVFVLAAGDVRSEGMFLLAGPADFITAHGKGVLPLIDAKGGGGKNGIIQGKAKGLRNLDALVAKLEELRV